jgi:hypothetical protein
MRSYTIKKIQGAPDWGTIPVMPIDNQPWGEPVDISAQAQICWDEENLYIRQEAWEKHIRREENGPLCRVCNDSCLEFFFRPTERMDFFNFEINPNCCTYIGVRSCREDGIRLAPKDEDALFQKQAARTADGWQVSYRIPVSFLRVLFPGYALISGAVIRANCYKCGDLTEKPHYLSWNPVENPTPDFHRSCDFGIMILE